MSTEEQAPPPEGALIRLARKARGLSVKEAAKLVSVRLGESRWYHIEAGAEGQGKRVIAPPETLAHMAHAVGIKPERLTEVGRTDAAEILAEIIRQSTEAAPQAPARQDPDLLRIIRAWPQLEQWQRNAVVGVFELTTKAPSPRSDTPANAGQIGEQRRTG